MEKKKKLIILGIIALTLVIIGTTYAILTWTSTKINLGLNSGCFTIDYTKGQDISGNLKLLNESDLISNNKFTIKNGIGISAVNIGINSTCTIEGFGSIYLNVTNISDAFTTGDSKGALKYAVLSNTSTITTPSSVTVDSLLNQSFEIVAKGSIESSGKKLLYKMELSNTEINKYIIVIYVDNALAGNSITSASFSGNISSEAEQKSPDYDADFKIETNEEDGTATITNYNGEEKDVVIPKMLRKVTITADVVSNPSEETISACEDYFINDLGAPSEYVGNLCKNGKDGNGMTLKEIITENFLTLSKLQQLEKIGSITLQTSYSSKKYVVTSIAQFAFNNRQLTSIVIPNSVITIGSAAFTRNKLTSIVIPSSVTTIDDLNSFDKNPFESICVDSNNPIYNSRDNSNAIIETSSNKLIQGSKNTVIPNSVTTIGRSAFDSLGITNITIPDSVTAIGDSAFFGNKLTSITIPNTVTSIGVDAFKCNKLTGITIPNSVTKIDTGAFSYNDLDYVLINLGSSLAVYGNVAFTSSNATYPFDGVTYVDNPNLKNIYNNPGKKFDWNMAVNGNSGTAFVTGTTNVVKEGNRTYNAVTITTGQPS